MKQVDNPRIDKEEDPLDKLLKKYPEAVDRILEAYALLKKAFHELALLAKNANDQESIDTITHTILSLGNEIRLRWIPECFEFSHAGVIHLLGEIDQANRAAQQEYLCSLPYADYLQTEHWQKTRTEALERALHCCQVCNSPTQLNVHHRTYERRGNELPEDLIVLCQSCHQLFHDNGKLQVKE